MDLLSRVVTVGVYVWVDDRVVFAFGPNSAGDRLAIVRVGGHREAGETPWQCAVREALEETTLAIEPVEPPATWLWLQDSPSPELIVLDWPADWGEQPVLVLPRSSDPGAPVNLMFLARAQGDARPDNEARGLLLLHRHEVVRLSRHSATLAELTAAGGDARPRRPLPADMPFAPGLQFRLLAELLERDMLNIRSVRRPCW